MSIPLQLDLRVVSDAGVELILQVILMWVWRDGSTVEEGNKELIYPQLWTVKNLGKGKQFGRV